MLGFEGSDRTEGGGEAGDDYGVRCTRGHSGPIHTSRGLTGRQRGAVRILCALPWHAQISPLVAVICRGNGLPHVLE